MFRFALSDFLYLLFLLPVLVAFYVYAIVLKKKAIKKYGNPELLAELMPEVSPKRQHLKFWLLFGAITMVIIVMAGPQFGAKLETVKRPGVEIMVCLDVSNSMLAEDVSPDRLSKAKQMLSKLTDGFSNDKVGLIVFRGRCFHAASYHFRLCLGQDVPFIHQPVDGVDTRYGHRRSYQPGDAFLYTERDIGQGDYPDHRW